MLICAYHENHLTGICSQHAILASYFSSHSRKLCSGEFQSNHSFVAVNYCPNHCTYISVIVSLSNVYSDMAQCFWGRLVSRRQKIHWRNDFSAPPVFLILEKEMLDEKQASLFSAHLANPTPYHRRLLLWCKWCWSPLSFSSGFTEWVSFSGEQFLSKLNLYRSWVWT